LTNTGILYLLPPTLHPYIGIITRLQFRYTCSAISTVWSETTRAKCWTFQTSWSRVSPGLSSMIRCGAEAVPGSRGPPDLVAPFRTATALPRQRPGPSWSGQSLNRNSCCSTVDRPKPRPNPEDKKKATPARSLIIV